ncbi:MAG: histidine phosphatase family protein [Clostridia bacterium]|nr:histidine phosphatase family protein [Clostridia bacterium]MBQ8557134.1 histidine phosphatase family protein [Clostridia bacterium]
MKWILIRHGQTQGNLEHRYIGCRTDEPLCPEGIAALQGKVCPPVGKVFVSPMKRCLETAALLYPSVPTEIVDDFRECDFGEWENKNYAELNGNADYQAWIDSGGELPFPSGESRAQFAARCVSAFENIPEQAEDSAIIAHGGTLMAIMERCAVPKGSYYDFQTANGKGYVLCGDGSYKAL